MSTPVSLPRADLTASDASADAASAPTGFTERDLRNALGQFATGVTVVTTLDEQGNPVGLTVSSFNSVSLQPPLVLWSLGTHAGTVAAFRQCSHYAIHVLSADQQALAEQFARRGVDRFSGVAHAPGLGQVPLLSGSVATFECRNRSQYLEGDHIIFVGEVVQVRSATANAPLLYHRGRLLDGGPLAA